MREVRGLFGVCLGGWLGLRGSAEVVSVSVCKGFHGLSDGATVYGRCIDTNKLHTAPSWHLPYGNV